MKPKDPYSNGSRDFWPMVAAAEALLAGIKIEHAIDGKLFYQDCWLVLLSRFSGEPCLDYTFEYTEEGKTLFSLENYQSRYSFKDRECLRQVCLDEDWPNLGD